MKFKDLKYTLIVPRTGVKPLDVIIRNEQNLFSWFRPAEGEFANAPLKSLFNGTDYPKTKRAEYPTELSGKEVLDAKGKFVGSFLERNSLSLDFGRNKQVLFSSENPVSTEVDWFELNEYLLGAIAKKAHEHLLQSGKIYIVLSVLASKKLNIQTVSNSGTDANLSTDELINPLVNLEASASRNTAQDFVINHEGDKYLTFAVKTARILFEKGKYTVTKKNIVVRSSNDEMLSGIEFYEETDEIDLED